MVEDELTSEELKIERKPETCIYHMSGIQGLSEKIVKNYCLPHKVITIEGPPGSFKTNFTAYLMSNYIKDRGKGIYVTLEQRAEDITEGLPENMYEKISEGWEKIKVVDYAEKTKKEALMKGISDSTDWYQKMLFFEDFIEEAGGRAVWALDSQRMLDQLFKKSGRGDRLDWHALFDTLRPAYHYSFVLLEIPGEEKISDNILETLSDIRFSADGNIQLFIDRYGNRGFRLMKQRTADIDTSEYYIELNPEGEFMTTNPKIKEDSKTMIDHILAKRDKSMLQEIDHILTKRDEAMARNIAELIKKKKD